MKKSLLAISSFCIFVWFGCKQTQNTQSESKPITNGTSTGSSTQGTSSETSSAETSGTTAGIKKDSTTSSASGNAIIHPVPNQEKIDSLKNVKKKVKDE